MFTNLFIRSSPKAYEVTKFVDDTPKILFDNANSFFIMRLHSRFTENINDSAIQFYGEMRTVKSEDIIRRYGFDLCVYDQHLKGVEKYYADFTRESLETQYLCLSKMFVNGS